MCECEEVATPRTEGPDECEELNGAGDASRYACFNEKKAR